MENPSDICYKSLKSESRFHDGYRVECISHRLPRKDPYTTTSSESSPKVPTTIGVSYYRKTSNCATMEQETTIKVSECEANETSVADEFSPEDHGIVAFRVLFAVTVISAMPLGKSRTFVARNSS